MLLLSSRYYLSQIGKWQNVAVWGLGLVVGCVLGVALGASRAPGAEFYAAVDAFAHGNLYFETHDSGVTRSHYNTAVLSSYYTQAGGGDVSSPFGAVNSPVDHESAMYQFSLNPAYNNFPYPLSVFGAFITDAKAQAQAGFLHAFAHTTVSVPATVDDNGGYPGFHIPVSDARTRAVAGMRDIVTIKPMNSDLQGQTARVEYTLSLSGETSAVGENIENFNEGSGFGELVGTCQTEWHLRGYIEGPEENSFDFWQRLDSAGNLEQSGEVSPTQQFHIVAELPLGEAKDLDIELFVEAYAQAGVDSGVFGLATANFADTLEWGGIQSVTVDGVPIDYTVSSDSGFDYSVAVPEPSTLVMLLVGMLAMFSRRRRVVS